MPILALLIFFAALLALIGIWARGFTSRRPGRSARRYTLLHDLPLFQRLRWAFAILVARFLPPPQGKLLLANFNSTEHLEGKISKIADNPFTLRFLIAKVGSDINHIDLAGAADEPLGVCTDAPVAGDYASVNVLGAVKGTQRGYAAAAITAGADIYTAAGGLLQAEPNTAGTYWLVGRAIMAAAAPNAGVYDDFEFTPTKPIKVVVIAAPTQTSAGTIAALHSTAVNPTKADFDALLAEAGKLQADYFVMANALASPALVKVI
jgi:hypothetical protein